MSESWVAGIKLRSQLANGRRMSNIAPTNALAMVCTVIPTPRHHNLTGRYSAYSIMAYTRSSTI